MADVFLSYARDDLGCAKAVAAALEKAGLSVWWDRNLGGGSEYSLEIERALKSAAAVVVLWSSSSVNSAWVRDEAAKGRDMGRLIPVTIDGTEPPLGFGQLHTIDLQRLSRRRRKGLELVVTAASEKVAGGSCDGSDALENGKSQSASDERVLSRPLQVGTAAAVAVVIIAAALLYLLNLQSSGAFERDGDGGTVAIGEFEPVSADQEAQRVARLTADAVERTFATNFIDTLSTRAAAPAALRKADFGLNGTVDRQGDELSVSANIIDARSGRTLWSTERTRSAAEGRELANELAIWVADVLRCSIYSKSKMQRSDSAEVESRVLRWCEAERSRGEQFDQMPSIAQELVDVAPDSGQAHAYLAMGLVLAYPERRREIQSAANRALQLDPNNGVARLALAAVPDPRVTLAERERIYREGMRLDPAFMYNRAQLSFLMRTVGRTEEATKLLGEVVSEYPLDFFQRAFWAFLLAETGNIRKAREEFDRIEQLRPGFRAGTREEIGAEILFGDPLKARPLIERWNPSEKDRKCIEFLIDARVEKRSPSSGEIDAMCSGGSVFRPGLLNALFGNLDDAFAQMERQTDEYMAIPRFGPRFLYYPELAAMRADRRFMPMMARLGIAQYWLQTGKWPDFCREPLPYDCRRAAAAAVAATKAR